MEFLHIPVLLNECIDNLNIKEDSIVVDGTAGGAGHSTHIAKKLKTGHLYAFDKDPDAIQTATSRLQGYPATVVQLDFCNAAQWLQDQGITAINGVLLDLGVSSHQLDDEKRGFSYRSDAPLDMRMSQRGKSAYDVVNGYTESQLTDILYRYGEEKFARLIAKKIVAQRQQAPIATTLQLADVVASALPAAVRRKQKHPAKQTFQAIRIEVNGELDSLSEGIDSLFEMLAPGGRMCIITFHSLEDRMVKHKFAALAKGCTCPPDFPICVCGNKPKGTLISKKPILPTEQELKENTRSHSAKLRVIEKI